MQPAYDNRPIRRLFAGFVEHAFYSHVGLCDPKVVDYVVWMLLEFVHVDRLYRLRDASGRRIETLAEMIELRAEGDQRPRITEREFHRYIGDFALFWTGLFPSAVERPKRAPNPDYLVRYVDQGKESYAIASSLSSGNTDPPRSVLKRLSQEFETCAHALGIVRHGWEEQERGDFPGRLVY